MMVENACFKKECYHFKIRCLRAFPIQTRLILSRLLLFAFFFWKNKRNSHAEYNQHILDNGVFSSPEIHQN